MKARISRRTAIVGAASALAGAAFGVARFGDGRIAAQEEATAAGGAGQEGVGGRRQISRFVEPVFGTSFVSPLVELFGDVFIGARSFVANDVVLRADPDRRLELGDDTNAQDNVIARAIDANSTVGNRSTLAHHANVRDSRVGNFAFVGFQATVLNAVVSDGALVSAGARVENVTLPRNALVPPGARITTQEQADALEREGNAEEEFKEAVLSVNGEFAESYVRLYEEEGFDAVVGIGPNPVASFNPQRSEPQIGEGTIVDELARVVGDVRIGPNSVVGERAAIRADEGTPIIIGANADIEARVTFHALEGTSIEVGDNLAAGHDAVLHGPLAVGDDLTVGQASVVFRVIVGDGVTVGEGVVIQGPALEEGEELSFSIPNGAVIPDGAVVTDEASLQAALAGAPQDMPSTGGVDPRDYLRFMAHEH